MYILSAIVLACAAVHAAPTAQATNAISRNATFSLAMRVGYGETAKNVSLVAVPSGTDSNSLVLVGREKSSKTRATPVYQNGTSPNAALDAIYHGKSYGLRAADVGDNYGIAVDVLATKGDQDFEWFVGEGEVLHKLYAGSNLLLACNRTINGLEEPVLAFGVINSNGSVPYKCQYTRVFTVKNELKRPSPYN